MFIIVGNDIKKKQVSIIDTSDYKTNLVSYDVMYNAINEGIRVLGVQSGEILCKTKNLYKELAPILQHAFLKAELLKVPFSQKLQMLLNVVQPYGLADSIYEISLLYETKTIILKRTATLVHLKKPFVIDYYVPLTYIDEFNKLDNQTKAMLMELCKIPIVPAATDILFVSRCTEVYYKGSQIEYFYYIETTERKFVVGVLPYQVEFTKEKYTREYARPNSPMLYRFYLRNLANATEHSCIISRLDRIKTTKRRPEGFPVYKKE